MAAPASLALPADLFHLFTAELAARADFSTLYNCAISSKQLANAGAISALYRISHESPVKGGGSETASLAEQDLTVRKWSILWRSVVLSSLGRTLYPYSRYVRNLDLRDLSDLLHDDKFRGQTAKHFFSGHLARFHKVLDTPALKSRAPRLDIRNIVTAIGDHISQQAPLLEVLTEPTIVDILSTALLTWAPRLENLRELVLFDGKALADETVRNLLHAHCLNLERVSIYRYVSDEADHNLAAFIGGRKDNTLAYFENLSNCGIGTETLLALNNHGRSLHTLKLALNQDGILALRYLQGCTCLETLAISSSGPPVDLKATQNDVYLEMVEWLKNCTRLREICLLYMPSAPDLLLPILLNDTIKLQKLEVNAKEGSMYLVKDHHDFHQALGQQATLRRLSITADPEPTTRDDNDVLMKTFCSLGNLRELNLTRVSDYFSNEHIDLLVGNLPNLEDLYIGGYGISDSILSSLSRLANLKTATFSGITAFTAEGVLDFIEQLDETHRGLLLSVDNADPDYAISQEGQDLIRDTFAAKLDGRFEYQLLRDPNVPEFDSDDSD